MKKLFSILAMAVLMAAVCAESAYAHGHHDAAALATSIVQFTPSQHHDLSNVNSHNERYIVGTIDGVSKGHRPVNIIQPAGAMLRDLEAGTTYTLALGEMSKKGDYVIIAILGQNREIGASLK